MKKLLLGTIFLALVSVAPVPTMAGTSVSIGICVPPITFAYSNQPYIEPMPGTGGVYVAPYVTSVDLFFCAGWWWYPWGGNWYCSHYYNHGWVYYSHNAPWFYHNVHSDWRQHYGYNNWNGQHTPNQSQQHWNRQYASNQQGRQNLNHQNFRNQQVQHSWRTYFTSRGYRGFRR